MKRVLVIDDEPVYRELVCFYLKQHGYVVLTADSAMSGIRLANQEVPDLILLELNLPDIDGLQTAHILKEENATQDITIVAFSDQLDEDELTLLKCYFDAVLIKPVHAEDTTELLHEVMSHLVAKRAQPLVTDNGAGKVVYTFG